MSFSSMMKYNSHCKEYLPSIEDCPHCHCSPEAREYADAWVQAFSDQITKRMLQAVLDKHGYY
jgi:hypothetical protein